MFWMRNKENNFPICTLIWRPEYTVKLILCLKDRPPDEMVKLKIFFLFFLTKAYVMDGQKNCLKETVLLMNAGQSGLESSRPESSRPGSTQPGYILFPAIFIRDTSMRCVLYKNVQQV